MRGDRGTGEGEINYPYPGSGFHRESKAFQHPAARPWRARGARETLLAASPSSGHWRLCPFLRDAVWSPNPRVGSRLCAPKRRDLVPHHCPAFLWALGPACSHHRAPKNIPACLCRLGLQEVHLPGTPAPLMHSTCQGGFLNKVCFLFFCATVIILFHQLQKINVSFQLEALA